VQVCYELNNDNYTRETKVFPNNNEKNILVYFLKEIHFDKNDNFELISFKDFIDNL
jgi:hypothetical protein